MPRLGDEGPFGYLDVFFQPVEFGNVAVGSTSDVELTLINTGDANVVFSLSGLAAPFSVIGGSGNLNPGQSTTRTVRFAPTGAGAASDTLNINHSGINTPINVPCSGTGVAVGTGELSFSPSSLDFGDKKIGDASAEMLVTVTNTGTVAVDITGLAHTVPFAAGATQPALPYNLAPAATVQFGVIVTPAVEGLVITANGVVITSTATGSPQDYECRVNGVLIVTAFVASGELSPLFAFANAMSVPVIKEMDPSDLDCEEIASFERIHDFQLPDSEKTLLRVGLRYEDKGPAELTLTGTVKRVQDQAGVLTQVPQTESDTVRLGTAAADDWPQVAMADLTIRGELIQIKASRAANGGPISLIDYNPKLEPMGESVEES